MKNKMMLLKILVLALLAFPAAVSAYSGVLMGVWDGNDKGAAFEANVNSWFINESMSYRLTDFDFYGKIESDGATEYGPSGGTLTLSGVSDNKSGILNAGNSISIYSVKASNQYAVYWLDPALNDFNWSTEALLNKNEKQHDMSHISAWTVKSPVPVPGTLMLFGTGLIGIVGLRRRGF